MVKVGLGSDIHRLERGDGLFLGGVFVPCLVKTIAHSDGDALLHAIIDSIVGITLKEDIGTLFPNTNSKYKNISSLELLAQIYKKTKDKCQINHIDGIIVFDHTKLRPFISEMEKRVGKILQLDSNQVTFKAKTSEKSFLDIVQTQVITTLEI